MPRAAHFIPQSAPKISALTYLAPECQSMINESPRATVVVRVAHSMSRFFLYVLDLGTAHSNSQCRVLWNT